MNIGVTLAAALLAPAPPAVDSALAGAARYCEAIVMAKKSTLPVPAGVTIHSDSGVPDLIRRFAATQPMTRMFGIDSYAHFHARNGQVWVVRSEQAVSCDIVVTAVPGGADALRDSFLKSLPGQGWQMRSSSTATPTKPLWRHSFVKWVPKASASGFGLVLDVRGLHPAASTEDGVQMELGFIGGDDLQVGRSPR
ncbi:MAG TPA: hypothetical protein VF645_09855 [Allosphingosinicella sp.]|jgi:hypothetical protein